MFPFFMLTYSHNRRLDNWSLSCGANAESKFGRLDGESLYENKKERRCGGWLHCLLSLLVCKIMEVLLMR